MTIFTPWKKNILKQKFKLPLNMYNVYVMNTKSWTLPFIKPINQLSINIHKWFIDYIYMSIHIPVFLLELVFWDLEAIRWMKTHNHMISNAIFNGFVTYVTNPDQTRFITNYNVSHYQILERNIYIPSTYSMILNVKNFWKICQLAMSKHKTSYFYYIFVQK